MTFNWSGIFIIGAVVLAMLGVFEVLEFKDALLSSLASFFASKLA